MADQATSTTPLDSAVRLHIVSGKGGTGKTTVAAALALALAGQGKTVLLCEVEGRQGIARLLDIDPLPYAERRITAMGGPGQLYALHIDAESALLDYLQMYYRLGPAGRALDRFGVIDFATTIAPGVRDVLLTGKVYEAARPDRRGGGRRYDAVVLDAPPTGRVTNFLGVNSELAGLARVGPVKTQADAVMALLKSPQTAVHFVTLLEEMPVQETIEAAAELTEAGLPVGAVIVNMVRPRLLDSEDLNAASEGGIHASTVVADLELAHLASSPALVDALIAGGVDHAARARLEAEQRAELVTLGLRTVELPRIADGIDSGALQELARELARQLLGSPAASQREARR